MKTKNSDLKKYWYELYEDGKWVFSSQSKFYAEELQKLWNCELKVIPFDTYR